MGIDEEKIEKIIAMHSETVDALKKRITKAELVGASEELRSQCENLRENYEKEHAELEKLKSEQENSRVRAEKENAFRSLLREAGIGEKRIGAVVRVSDIDSLKLEDGKISGYDETLEKVKTEWADFIETASTVGAQEAAPPSAQRPKAFTRDDIKRMSASQINENWDAIMTSFCQ